MENNFIFRRPGASFVYVCPKFRRVYDSTLTMGSSDFAHRTPTEARIHKFVSGRATLAPADSQREFPRPFPWAPSSWLLWPIVCSCGRISDLSRLEANSYVCDLCFRRTVGDQTLLSCFLRIVSMAAMDAVERSGLRGIRNTLPMKNHVRLDIWASLVDIDIRALTVMLSISNDVLAEAFVDEGFLTKVF